MTTIRTRQSNRLIFWLAMLVAVLQSSCVAEVYTDEPRIIIRPDNVAYTPAETIQPDATPTQEVWIECTAMVDGNYNVRLRSGPGTDYPQVTDDFGNLLYIEPETEYSVTAISLEWVAVLVPVQGTGLVPGWVYRSLVFVFPDICLRDAA